MQRAATVRDRCHERGGEDCKGESLAGNKKGKREKKESYDEDFYVPIRGEERHPALNARRKKGEGLGGRGPQKKDVGAKKKRDGRGAYVKKGTDALKKG